MMYPYLLKRVFLIGIVVVSVFLLYSVIRSGLFYQYDVDELSHTQHVYLIDSGFKPYVSVFMRFSPVFYWFQWPIFHVFGFNFFAIQLVRILMAVLFLIRIGVSTFLIRKLFGKRVALFFIPIFLLDPFTVFSGMQIRPDNLAILVYTAGLCLFGYAITRQSLSFFLYSGCIISFALLLVLKMLPSVAVILVIFGLYVIEKKKMEQGLLFLTGCAMPWVLFAFYTVLAGSFPDMIQQVFLDSAVMNSAHLYPGYAAFYYKPDNMYLFGFPGKPLTWIYALLLPVIAMGGIIYTLRKSIPQRSIVKTILAVSCIIQYIWIFTTVGAFVQYFLSVSWLLALFAAVFLSEIVDVIGSNRYLTIRGPKWLRVNGIYVFYSILFLFFAYTSIRANLFRAAIGSQSLIEQYTKIWQTIPENEYTYPNFLYRPIAYPLHFGTNIWDIPKPILKRFGPVSDYLEKYSVKYVFFDSFSSMFHDQKTREYIETHYMAHPEENSFYIRRTEK